MEQRRVSRQGLASLHGLRLSVSEARACQKLHRVRQLKKSPEARVEANQLWQDLELGAQEQDVERATGQDEGRQCVQENHGGPDCADPRPKQRLDCGLKKNKRDQRRSQELAKAPRRREELHKAVKA